MPLAYKLLSYVYISEYIYYYYPNFNIVEGVLVRRYDKIIFSGDKKIYSGDEIVFSGGVVLIF